MMIAKHWTWLHGGPSAWRELYISAVLTGSRAYGSAGVVAAGEWLDSSELKEWSGDWSVQPPIKKKTVFGVTALGHWQAWIACPAERLAGALSTVWSNEVHPLSFVTGIGSRHPVATTLEEAEQQALSSPIRIEMYDVDSVTVLCGDQTDRGMVERIGTSLERSAAGNQIPFQRRET